jgi:hypothetical protein
MQHKINKENLAIALKKRSLTFLEFLQVFVKVHVTKGNKQLDPQETHIFDWIKKIYNNSQEHYEENTINTLCKILKVTPEFLIDNSQQDLIQEFNLGYENYLRARIINYVKSQNIKNIKLFLENVKRDVTNYLEGL